MRMVIVRYSKLYVEMQNIYCSELPSWHLVRPGSILTPCACVHLCAPLSTHDDFKCANITAVAVWLVKDT